MPHFLKGIKADLCEELAETLLEPAGFEYIGTYRDGGTVVYGYHGIDAFKFRVGNVGNNPEAPFGYVEIEYLFPVVLLGNIIPYSYGTVRLSREKEQLQSVIRDAMTKCIKSYESCASMTAHKDTECEYCHAVYRFMEYDENWQKHVGTTQYTKPIYSFDLECKAASEIWIRGNTLFADTSAGECDVHAAINFCPMCGRQL